MKIKSFRVKVTLILILMILIIISTIFGLLSYLLNLNLKERVNREINSYRSVISYIIELEKWTLEKQIKVSIIKLDKDFYIYGVGPVCDENRKKFYGVYLLFAKKIDSEYIRELEKIIDAKITFVFSNQANSSTLEDYYSYPYIHLAIPLNNEIYIVIDKQDPSLYEFNKILLAILGISLGVISLFFIVFMQILLNHFFKPFEKLVDISHNIANVNMM